MVWIYQRAQKERALALDISLAIMVGGLIGARLTHVFYENFSYYQTQPWDVFKVWQGGFVFDGGFIGATVATFLFLRWRREPFLKWADFFAPVLALGYGLGRLGCFLNGCCFGKLCELPWAVEFHYPGLPTSLRHPTQLYASLWELGVVAVLLLLEKYSDKIQKKVFKTQGALFFTWLSLHAVGRLMMEHFRDDYRGAEPLGQSVATWWALAMLFISLIFFIKRRPK